MQIREVLDFPFDSLCHGVQFAVIVPSDLVNLFVPILLHQHVGRKRGKMKVFWTSLVVGQTLSH